MFDLSFLRGNLNDSTICRLERIFATANNTREESVRKKLQEELRSVFQQENPGDIFDWEISPSGNNHVIIAGSLCLFVNIWGIRVLFKNYLFLEGELWIKNFHWIERDNLVIFDLHYIVHDEVESCICHFAPDDFLVYFTAARKKSPESIHGYKPFTD